MNRRYAYGLSAAAITLLVAVPAHFARAQTRAPTGTGARPAASAPSSTRAAGTPSATRAAGATSTTSAGGATTATSATGAAGPTSATSGGSTTSATGTTGATGALRAVFHLSDPSRATVARGLQNVTNALRTMGNEPAQFVIVVHGPALQWFRRAESENLGPQVAALLATRRVEWRVCRITLDENHWRPEEIVAGFTLVPSGTLEVLRLEQQGYAYFHP